MTLLYVDANARRASACTVTRESTTDTGRDPSFDGSLHIHIFITTVLQRHVDIYNVVYNLSTLNFCRLLSCFSAAILNDVCIT